MPYSQTPRRVSWNPKFKKQVIEELQEKGTTEVFHDYGEKIPKRTLQYWKANPPKESKESKAQFERLDDELFEWILVQRSRKNPVTDKLLQDKAVKIAKKLVEVYKEDILSNLFLYFVNISCILDYNPLRLISTI